MSKRKFIVTAVIVVLALSMSLLVACGGDSANKDVTLEVPGNGDAPLYPDNFVAVDYSEMEEVAGVDAFDLLCEVYDTWSTDKGYMREQYFSFKAEPVGKAITNFCHEVYKIDGDELSRRRVVIQNGAKVGPLTLADDKYEITRFYWDGTAAKRVVEDDAKNKTNIPGDPNHEGGLFYVAKDPAMVEFTGDAENNVADMLKTYTTHMTTYKWRNKDNLMDNGFKVYKASDGSLRFTIEINCDDSMMQNPDVHYDAWKEFEESTGASEGTIHMRKNTTIDFIVKEYNGVKKIAAWRRTEVYEGKKGAKIPAQQTCIETFSYDEADYKLTDADRK